VAIRQPGKRTVVDVNSTVVVTVDEAVVGIRLVEMDEEVVMIVVV